MTGVRIIDDFPARSEGARAVDGRFWLRHSGEERVERRTRPSNVGKVKMPALHRIYINDVYKNTQYRPTWLPGTPVELGTVGTMRDGVFVPVSSLAHLGISFDTLEDPVSDGQFDYASTGSTVVSFKAAGALNEQFKVLTTAEAGALVQFSREGAVVIQMKEVTSRRIADQPALFAALLKSVKDPDEGRRWRRPWAAITETITAGSTTIVIAGAAGSSVELKAAGSIEPASLADVSAGFSIARQTAVNTSVVAKSGLTPLFRSVRVRRKFGWLWDEIELASPAGVDPGAAFADADPDEDDVEG